MVGFRVFGRLSYGKAPGFGQACDGCDRAITTTEWMSLICADEWKAVRLHEDCFVLWEEEKRTAA
jgi:hypothetical protein